MRRITGKQQFCVILVGLLAANIASGSNGGVPLPEDQSSKWSVQFPLAKNIAPLNQMNQQDSDLKISITSADNNLSNSQDALFDELKDVPMLSAKTIKNPTNYDRPLNQSRWSGIATREPALGSIHQLYKAADPNYRPKGPQINAAAADYQSTAILSDFGFPAFDNAASQIKPQDFIALTRPNPKDFLGRPAPLSLNQIALHPLTREILAQLNPTNEMNILPTKPLSAAPSPKNPGVKLKSSVSKTKRKLLYDFKDGSEVERSDVHYLREHLVPQVAHIPLIYDTRAPVEPRTPKDVEDEPQMGVWSHMDNMMAGSKHMPMSYPMAPYYAASYGPMMGHKRIEKPIATPIMIGVAAALISFLILSNLFLSIPLFAMTLFQFFGGNMIMPNNNNTPNTNGQNQNGLNSNGRRRRKRDLEEFDFERQILKAIGDLQLG